MQVGPGDSHPRDRLGRQLTLTDATFLLVASVIGAGIFFTPGRVAELLPHPGWILAAWLLGALLSVAGALANAELATMFPRAGGDYVYLREAIHPVAGFLVGWLTFFAIYAGTIAALAAAFAEGVAAQLGLSTGGTLAVAIAVTVATSGLNYIGARWGARANNLTSVIKVLALVAFAVLGPIFGDGDVGRLLPRVADAGFELNLSSFGLAMSPILFTFLGWNAAVYVGSEIRDPARNLPRSLFLGLAICTGVYVLMNGVYLYALPMAELTSVGDAGEATARSLFGPVGGTLLAIFVLISVLGTLNATVLVGPRIAYAMSLDGLFFRGAEHVHSEYRTPTGAILVQGLVAVGLLVVLRSFPSALDFTTFAVVLATSADVVALYLLRRRQPDRPRPYRAWGYPIVPGLYLLANMAIAVAMIWGRPLECAIGLGMLLAGLPFYVLFIRQNADTTGDD
jgi:APA family basic amino acid/polyamine antiporter